MLLVMSIMKTIRTLKLYSLYLFTMNKITLNIHVKSHFRLNLNSLLCINNHMLSEMSIIRISIYHTSEQSFLRALIGQLGDDQPCTIHLQAAKEKQNGFCRYIVTSKVTLGAASYSACVVYTKTIIHLSVGESGGYLPRCYSPPLR